MRFIKCENEEQELLLDAIDHIADQKKEIDHIALHPWQVDWLKSIRIIKNGWIPEVELLANGKVMFRWEGTRISVYRNGRLYPLLRKIK